VKARGKGAAAAGAAGQSRRRVPAGRWVGRHRGHAGQCEGHGEVRAARGARWSQLRRGTGNRRLPGAVGTREPEQDFVRASGSCASQGPSAFQSSRASRAARRSVRGGGEEQGVRGSTAPERCADTSEPAQRRA